MFITNQHNHYFDIAGNAAINTSKLKNCLVHETKDAMFAHVVNITDLTISKVEHHEIFISYCVTNQCFKESDGHAGFMSEIVFDDDETIEDYLSSFEL